MFNGNTNGYSLADIAAATGGYGNRDSGWGGDGWWLILILMFCWGGFGYGDGFGRYGFGGGTVNSPAFQGALTRADLCEESNFNNLSRAIESGFKGSNEGFASAALARANNTAALQSSLCQGFNTVQNTITNGDYDILQSINSNTVANMQNTNAITAQLNNMAAQQAACCCDSKTQMAQGFSDLNYNLATQECQTRQAVTDSARDIIDNQNANTRSILDFLTQDRLNTLTAENQSLKFAASQQAQNAYLVQQLGAKPVMPAYVVPNPYTGSYNYNYGGCGCNYNTGALA